MTEENSSLNTRSTPANTECNFELLNLISPHEKCKRTMEGVSEGRVNFCIETPCRDRDTFQRNSALSI